MKQWIRKLTQATHRLQWQLVLTVMLAFFAVSLLILGVRIHNAVKAYAKISSGTLISAIARQISDNRWFQDMEEENILPNPQMETESSIPISENEPQHFVIPLDFGSILRDMQIHLGGLPEQNVNIFYIDSEGNAWSLVFDHRYQPKPPRNGTPKVSIRSNVSSEEDMEGIIEKGLRLSEKTDFEQVILSDSDWAMALVPHQNKKAETNGYYYIYMRRPALFDLIRPMLSNSIREIFGTALLLIPLSLLCGWFFARNWSRWFTKVSQVMNGWSQGLFSQKIDVEKTPYVTEWRELANQLNEMSEELEQVVETRQKLAASEERNSLARELHDNIKQQLFSLNMNLGAAKVWMEKDAKKAKEKLELSAKISQDTLLELDSLIATMRPPAVQVQSSVFNFEKLAEDWENCNGIRLKRDIQGSEKLTDERTISALYRIAQEGLSNIARHAHASQAELKLRVTETATRLIITDNGCGFDPEAVRRGVGLNSMKERTEALNGSMEIQSSKAGTMLIFYIPLSVKI